MLAFVGLPVAAVCGADEAPARRPDDCAGGVLEMVTGTQLALSLGFVAGNGLWSNRDSHIDDGLAAIGRGCEAW